MKPNLIDVLRPVIEVAAAAATWCSKARNSAKAEVHVCRQYPVS